MIDASAIDHVCLSVSFLARSQEYYERVFGASCKLRDGDPGTLVVEALHMFISSFRSRMRVQNFSQVNICPCGLIHWTM